MLEITANKTAYRLFHSNDSNTRSIQCFISASLFRWRAVTTRDACWELGNRNLS